jgi:hypothetical protein
MNQIVTSLLAGCRDAAHKAASLRAIMPGTPVLTASGPVPAEAILPGTRLITRSGMCPVLAIHRHSLDTVAVVRLKAGSLGPGIPSQDLCLPTGQTLILPLVLPHRPGATGSIALRPRAQALPAHSLAAHGVRAQTELLENATLLEFVLPGADYLQAASVQVLATEGPKA